MKSKTRGPITMFVLMVLAWTAGSFLFSRFQDRQPAIILTDANGQKTAYFRAMDSVFGSFSGLLPDTEYTILIMRSDEKELTRSILTADKRGIIPTIALWGDIGVEHTGSPGAKFAPHLLSRYTYRCLVQHRGETVTEVPIRVMPVRESEPVIYSSSENGDPLHRFIYQKEEVYLTGKNFPAGARMYIHVVPDGLSRETGGRLDAVSGKVHEVILDENQRDFTTMIASGTDLSTGAYDFIIEFETANGLIDGRDLIPGIRNPGFTIRETESYPGSLLDTHVEAELACQAPPQDPGTGTVIGAPTPVYKNNFAANEEVWAAVDPYTAGQDYSNQTARLYVVYHQTEINWVDGTALTDVSGGYETVTIQPGSAGVNHTRIWSSPTVREDGYDVVVDFEPFGFYDKGQDIIDSLDAGGFVVPTLWVCLDSISFNHDSSSDDTDAMSIRVDRSLDVSVPEWVKAEESYPAAYIKNKTITVKAVFSAAAGVTGANIRAAAQSGYLGDAVQTAVSFSSGTSGAVSFQISANTPGAIRNFFQVWRWYCGNVNGSGSPEVHVADSSNKIFIVFAQPQAPWGTTGPRKIWASALDKACAWASGETTPEGAADKISRELFLNTGGLYDTYSGAPSYTNNGGTGGFDLTNFLANISNIGVVNCYDMGKSLVTLANAAGCGLSYRYSGPFGYLNCIYAIGRGWTNNPFCGNPAYDPNPIVPEDWSSADGRSGFGNHAFGSIVDNIFDACLTVDTDGNPDYGPPFTETWMLDEPWTGYKIKVVDDIPAYNTAYPTTFTFNIK